MSTADNLKNPAKRKRRAEPEAPAPASIGSLASINLSRGLQPQPVHPMLAALPLRIASNFCGRTPLWPKRRWSTAGTACNRGPRRTTRTWPRSWATTSPSRSPGRPGAKAEPPETAGAPWRLLSPARQAQAIRASPCPRTIAGKGVTGGRLHASYSVND